MVTVRPGSWRGPGPGPGAGPAPGGQRPTHAVDIVVGALGEDLGGGAEELALAHVPEHGGGAAGSANDLLLLAALVGARLNVVGVDLLAILLKCSVVQQPGQGDGCVSCSSAKLPTDRAWAAVRQTPRNQTHRSGHLLGVGDEIGDDLGLAQLLPLALHLALDQGDADEDRDEGGARGCAGEAGPGSGSSRDADA